MNQANYQGIKRFKVCIFWISISFMTTIFLSSCLPLKQTYGGWEYQGARVLSEFT